MKPLNFNYNISIIRIVSMIMILVCHYGTAFNYPSIGQFFQVGVQIFLIISGFLYGCKTEKNFNISFSQRFFKITYPCYVMLFFLIIYSLINDIHFSIEYILLFIFNLQGYHHIFYSFPYLLPVEGTAHLWFITIIYACYLLTIIFNNIDPFYLSRKEYLVKWTMIIIAIQLLFSCIYIRIDYFIVFFFGFLFGRVKPKVINKLLLASLFLLSVILRLSFKYFCDIYGDTALYIMFVIPLSYNLMAIAMFSFLYYTPLNQINKLSYYMPIKQIDLLTLYIYIVHYAYIDGPLIKISTTSNYFDFFFSITLTLLSAILLQSIVKITTTNGRLLNAFKR